MFYIVNEIQVVDGVQSVLNFVFTDQREAEAKYYSVLAVAALSTIDYHGATLIFCDESIVMLLSKAYENRVVTENA